MGNPINNMKTLIEADFEEVGKYLNLDPNLIKTVTDVEASGSGFTSDGNPKVLFEGHIFFKQLKKKYGLQKAKLLSEKYPNLVFPKWTTKFYQGGKKEFERLKTARNIDSECANMSASWGLFQILGENYRMCKCRNVDEFVRKMSASEKEQLILFGNFIKSSGLLEHLRNHQWDKFARGYNGPKYKENKYDEKLKEAFERYSVSNS